MRKNMFSLIKTKFDQTKAGMTAIAAGAAMLPTKIMASGFSSYSGTDANKVMTGFKNFFGTIGTWGGGLLTVVAIFAMILSVNKEDTEARNKAALLFLGGIALLSTGAIISLFFS